MPVHPGCWYNVVLESARWQCVWIIDVWHQRLARRSHHRVRGWMDGWCIVDGWARRGILRWILWLMRRSQGHCHLAHRRRRHVRVHWRVDISRRVDSTGAMRRRHRVRTLSAVPLLPALWLDRRRCVFREPGVVMAEVLRRRTAILLVPTAFARRDSSRTSRAMFGTGVLLLGCASVLYGCRKGLLVCRLMTVKARMRIDRARIEVLVVGHQSELQSLLATRPVKRGFSFERVRGRIEDASELGYMH